MSILKKIAGAFVEMEDEQTKPKSQPKKTTPQPVIASSAIHEVTPHVVSGTVDPNKFQEFRKTFQKILDDENRRNFPGNDYYEFVVMKNAMNIIPQEDIKYTAAFAGWSQGQNNNKQDLLKTAKVYLGLVDKEITDFNVVYKQEYEQQVVKNETLIQQKMEQVRKLTEQVNQISLDITNLKNQNASNTEDLRLKYEAFMTAGAAQREEIETEILKINQYIN